jgi:hypothetical protein
MIEYYLISGAENITFFIIKNLQTYINNNNNLIDFF